MHYHQKKKSDKWIGWTYIAARCKSVISISNESLNFAKLFYDKDVRHEWLRFPVYQKCDVKKISWEDREDSAICISRMDPHKGLDGLIEFLKNTNNLKNFLLNIGFHEFDKSFEHLC